ncbi:MAG: phenylalanine--tRNA ligase subunit beta [Candidatus Roizmanbacteria bacterium]|nr:phenylalanine--tRNA ligase subunit beta [Candidatus Roizmanbacteria bacterium]
MNIKITHNWLLDYLDTDATPVEIQKYLSLCGPSVERIEEVNGEIVYDIEITTNRIDTASVLGIAREAAAILPQFGKKAILKKKELSQPIVSKTIMPISITDPSGVCRRLLGIVMEVDGVGKSPEYISKRLTAIDMRSLNNIVDVTNYVMTEIGHPTHVFDYDRIETHNLILRHAKKGEEIVTLDEKKYNLDETDIIIDDGTGKVIDLPGIMGTANSVVTNNTKRILFFIESNDPVSIRRTSMRYGIRTMASTINEKNPDSELALTAFLRGIELFKEVADAKVVSPLIDIYPKKAEQIEIKTSKSFIDAKVGVEIPLKTIVSILTNLEFTVSTQENDELIITVPTHRISDVTIPEDIVEEVARVYGYFAIPSVLQLPAYVTQPKDTELLFYYQYVVKSYLKHRGYTEVMNYSATSKELLQQFEVDKVEHLYITNSISEDIKYLRQSLIPSLVKNVKQNEGFAKEHKLFELAKTYIPSDSLPIEENKLSICTSVSLDELKSILIGLMKELNIEFDFKEGSTNIHLMPSVAGELTQGKIQFGSFGQVKPILCRNLGLEAPVYVAELSFVDLIQTARVMPNYKSFSQYAHITHDITIKKDKTFAELKKNAFSASNKLISLSLLSTYKDTITLRLEFTDSTKNLTEEEVKREVEAVQKYL